MKLQIKLESNKNVIIDNVICNYLDPENIYIPILKKEDIRKQSYVYKNEFFGHFIVSVSGKIKGTKKVLIKNKYYPALKVINDYKENQKEYNHYKIKTLDELIFLVKEYNLNDIVKELEKKNIKNLIINAIDEDIYSYSEIMILANYYNQIFKTIEKLLKLFNIEKAFLNCKNTYALAIQKVKSEIGSYPNIKLNLLLDRYLMSNKTNICHNFNIKEEETIILNVSQIMDLYNIINNKLLNENILTISGDVLLKSYVIKTRVGVSLEELMNNLLKINNNDYEIYINGLFKGQKITNISDIIITRDIKLIVFKKKELINETECINCGVCLKVCPFNIDIVKCYQNKLKDNRCIGCSLCNYVCPAKIKLKDIIYGDKDED